MIISIPYRLQTALQITMVYIVVTVAFLGKRKTHVGLLLSQTNFNPAPGVSSHNPLMVIRLTNSKASCMIYEASKVMDRMYVAPATHPI